jgi:hypothetical protein
MWTGTTPQTAPHRYPIAISDASDPEWLPDIKIAATIQWEFMGYHGRIWASMEFASKETVDTVIATIDLGGLL